MSWKSRALEMIEKRSIKFTDSSTAEFYSAVLEAPEGHVFWATDQNVVYPSLKRFKGSDKSKFWYDLYCWAELGTGPEEDMAEYMRIIDEAEELTFNK